MSSNRESQLRTAAVKAILNALGTDVITYGDYKTDDHCGTHLTSYDKIVQSSVWAERRSGMNDLVRYRYDVVVTVEVNAVPLMD